MSRTLAERFEIREVLGRGGMGKVYRAYDRAHAREVALKQLQCPPGKNEAAIGAMFEQEFRTLAQLEHPCVIHVYDYGLDEAGAYYTMELLEGSNLANCAPLPWRKACALVHDVCLSLALLHSRRLLHRDVSPHNVRRTGDGRAKLLDFGVMTTMGPNEHVVGTPSFIAPEVTQRSTLDARTDLFSLGATLYFALTAKLAYPARAMAELVDAWNMPPAPPSTVVPEIPARLDRLVPGLLYLDPAQRPRTASEVMQRLVAIAGIERRERLDASRTYLSTPALVGRESLQERVRSSANALAFMGPPGSGRSRALGATALEVQTLGATVVRASAKNAPAQVAAHTARDRAVRSDAAPITHRIHGIQLSDSPLRARDRRLRESCAFASCSS